MIPGLLQTEEYIRSLMRVGRSAISEAAEDIEARGQFRLERQGILDREDPPLLWFVIGEAAIRRPVGRYEVLRDQLRHLLEVVDQYHNITFQVAPLSIADHPLLGGSIGSFRFGGAVPDTAHQATFIGGGVYMDDEADITECVQAFDRLRAVALGPDESRKFIGARMEELLT